ncbi:hypothetical protein D3C87_262240 [compost metagenome]
MVVDKMLSPFFISRSPLLPYNHIINFYRKIERGENGLNELVKLISQEKLALEAIYLTSQSLYRDFLLYQENPNNLTDKEQKKLYLSLLKYFIRMTTRCTPFGLFASSTLVRFNEQANPSGPASISLTSGLKTHRRLGMDFWSGLLSRIEQLENVRSQLTYFPNSSLAKVGNTWKYISFSFIAQQNNTEEMNIHSNEILAMLIRESKNGLHIGDLIQLIAAEGYAEEEAIAYVGQLIDQQVLVSELYPHVTGNEFQAVILDRLLPLVGDHPALHDTLLSLKTQLTKISKTEDGALEEYLQIEELINQLGAKELIAPPFQAELYRTVDEQKVPETLKTTIQECIELLSMLSPSIPNKMEAFRDSFMLRYDHQQVPLALALDSDVGIPYKTKDEPELFTNQDTGTDLKWNNATRYKFSLYRKALQDQLTEVTLDEASISKLGNQKELPDSFAFIGNLLRDRDTTRIIFGGISGPSFGNLISRFCHGNEEIMHETMDLMAVEEQNHTDCIFAELAHLPQSRLGNIINRPHLRDYEIPYLAGSELPLDRQLKLDDLFLQIHNNELMLISRSLGKRVIPRLTTAHAYEQESSLPVYRFLGDLQQQQRKYIFWDWEFLKNEPFLPRVIYKDMIVSPAYWNILREEMKPFQKLKGNALLEAFTDFRIQRNIPDHVSLSDADNLLLLSLITVEGVELLVSESKRTTDHKLVLKENLFSTDNLLVSDAEGVYVSEMLIPFVKTTKQQFSQPETTSAEASQRKFLPGDSWIYYKIYTGTGVSDNILCDVIQPISRKLTEQGIISDWFFIRYTDPDYHLRLRFKLTDSNQVHSINTLVNESLREYMEQDIVWRLQLDTYVRELERYGHQTIDLTESLFCLNSNLIIDLYRHLFNNNQNQDYRMLCAIAVTDSLINAFTDSAEEKYAFAQKIQAAYAKEFNIEGNTQKIASANFRTEKQKLEQLFDLKEVSDELVAAIRLIIGNYEAQTKALVSEIIALDYPTNDFTAMETLICSHIHMFMNRFYTTNQRFFELVMYITYEQWLKSVKARKKVTSNTVSL